MLKKFQAKDNGGADGGHILWLDLLDPTESERLEAEGLAGFPLPTLASLSEIESSSRLRSRDSVLTMSTPMIRLAEAVPVGLAPVGFVLSCDTLVTIRFSEFKAFDEVSGQFGGSEPAPTCSLEIFARLCDEIVDRLADALESIAASLNELSGAIFRAEELKGRAANSANILLRDQLKQIGRFGDRASNTRDALLGLGRAIAFTGETTKSWEGARFEAHLESLRQDVTSLNDYEVHLSDKIQFLLDAQVGMIGIAQNDVVKALTIVSIVGIPPTLMAGVYGMNFKFMPELNWPLGYPYGLAVIVISAVIPALWFKWRGWF